MSKVLAVTAALLALCGTGAAQAPAPQPPTSTVDSPNSGDGLRDLDALTFSCSRAALNAAAREAAKAPAQGTYQFAYFKIIAGSHHASYEVHFTSNYEGEPELKYCVMLYCQQGWDPAAGKISIARMTADTRARHGGSCTQHPAGALKGAPGSTKTPPAR